MNAMRSSLLVRAASALFGVFLAIGSGASAAPPAAPPPHTDTAVFAGGCFWGMELVFESLKGVTSVVSGYSGGAKATANYEAVSTGGTGHAESVEITYDPAVISYRRLLDVYFRVAHDPTELDRQGPDEGTQYRSAIFYSGERQKQTALESMRDLTAAKAFPRPIVTQVVPLRGFYAAESYHQHFAAKNPTYPYIVYNDAPKAVELRAHFPQLVKPAN